MMPGARLARRGLTLGKLERTIVTSLEIDRLAGTAPRVAWVTGASSGIGAAVAVELARRGWTVAASARRAEHLEALAQSLPEEVPGRIVAHRLDVTDADGLAATVNAIERVHGPITLAFLNAGVAPGSDAGGLDLAALEQALAVNLMGVARPLALLMDRMAARGQGTIAVNTSLVGYRGLPGAAAYGASKAAAIHLCESLAFDCARHGIALKLVAPGFVDTPMVAGQSFAKPMMVAVEDAARRIVDGLGRPGFEIAFPRRMAWLVKLLRVLPYPAYAWLVARLDRRLGKGRNRGPG